METKVIGTVGDILARKGNLAWSISPDATVFDALKLMSLRNVGALLVMDKGFLVGLMSERDYARKIALLGKTSEKTLVREIMTRDVKCATRASTVEECMRVMTDKRTRHLPVVEGERVVGIVSIGDLVNWTISIQEAAIDQLESYITGQSPGP